MSEDTFYLCNPESDEVIIAGELSSVLENAEVLRLDGELCNQVVDKRGKSVPGDLIGIIQDGRAYWFPFNNTVIMA